MESYFVDEESTMRLAPTRLPCCDLMMVQFWNFRWVTGALSGHFTPVGVWHTLTQRRTVWIVDRSDFADAV